MAASNDNDTACPANTGVSKTGRASRLSLACEGVQDINTRSRKAGHHVPQMETWSTWVCSRQADNHVRLNPTGHHPGLPWRFDLRAPSPLHQPPYSTRPPNQPAYFIESSIKSPCSISLLSCAADDSPKYTINRSISLKTRKETGNKHICLVSYSRRLRNRRLIVPHTSKSQPPRRTQSPISPHIGQ